LYFLIFLYTGSCKEGLKIVNRFSEKFRYT
jgi:hypothetical protein